MVRWNGAFVVLLLGIGGLCFLSGTTRAQAGFCMRLDLHPALPHGVPETKPRDRALMICWTGNLCRCPEPGPNRLQPRTANFPTFSPRSISPLLSPGAKVSLFFDVPCREDPKANPQGVFSDTSTVRLLATGRQRFTGRTPDGAAELQKRRAAATRARHFRPTIAIDIRPPSSLVLAMLGCTCCLLWFAWQTSFWKV